MSILFQATYSSDVPSETSSKISLVDLAGRLVTACCVEVGLSNGFCLSVCLSAFFREFSDFSVRQ